MNAYNFVRNGRNFTIFKAEKIVLANAYGFCRYFHRFQRYFCWDSQVVV